MVVLGILQMHGQVMEGGDNFTFQYTTAPSIGKHQLDTYQYAGHVHSNVLSLKSRFTIDYSNNRFQFFDLGQNFDYKTIDDLHRIQLSWAGTKPIFGSWSLFFQSTPQLASNFNEPLSNDDLVFEYAFGLKKEWKTSSLIAGIMRSTVFGEPTIVPLFSYRKQLGNRTTFQIGFPKTFLKTEISDRHGLCMGIAADGYYYNISGDIGLLHTEATKMEFSRLDYFLKHTYSIQPGISTIVQLGFYGENDLQITNENSETLYNFQTNESVYFSMGLEINLNRNK